MTGASISSDSGIQAVGAIHRILGLCIHGLDRCRAEDGLGVCRDEQMDIPQLHGAGLW